LLNKFLVTFFKRKNLINNGEFWAYVCGKKFFKRFKNFNTIFENIPKSKDLELVKDQKDKSSVYSILQKKFWVKFKFLFNFKLY